MFDTLKRLAQDGALSLEVQALRADLSGVRSAVERIAAALECQNAHAYPPPVPPDPSVPAVEVAYVNDQAQAEWMDIEMRLTAARGLPPSEEEMLAEFERRHPQGQDQGAQG